MGKGARTGAISGRAKPQGGRGDRSRAVEAEARAGNVPLVGVGEVSRALAGALAAGRVAHAYLLVLQSQELPLREDRPAATMIAALSVAKRLNCENPIEDRACGGCLSCRLVDDGNHPDVRVLSPDGLSIKIGQIRQVRQEMSYRSRRLGGYRVTIVEDAERMTPEAQNSFLRILEEPPGNAVFLLLTSNPSGLLPTVRSRCQLVRVCRKPAAADRDAPGDLLGLVRRARTLSALEVLQEAEAVETRLQASGTGEQPRREIEAALVAAAMWYRDVLVFKTTGDAGLAYADGAKASSGKLSQLEADASSRETDEIIRVIDAIEEARRHIRKNANTRLVLEGLLFGLRVERGEALHGGERAL